MPRRLFGPLVILVILAGAVGCSSATSGNGGPFGGELSGGFPSSDATQPSSPPIAAPTLSTGSSPSAAQQDFTSVHYATPAGFVSAPSGPGGYSPAIPLEDRYTAFFLVPANKPKGFDVISVIVYTLPQANLVDTVQEQSNRVAYYNHKLAAVPQQGVRQTTLAGLSSFAESVLQPPDFRYDTTIAFGSGHVLQVSCQIPVRPTTDQITTNSRACGSVLSSIAVR